MDFRTQMDLMPSAEELRDHLLCHDLAVRQIILLDGYIERLSEQTFVSAIGNRLAIAFQKMIRISIAEGLKRMYKEYRLNQWQKLVDKAATLRRMLEERERELDNDISLQSNESQNEIQGQTEYAPGDSQHSADWQRAAPEAYDWYPVNDYQNTADSSRIGSQPNGSPSTQPNNGDRPNTNHPTNRSMDIGSIEASQNGSPHNLLETVSQDEAIPSSNRGREILDLGSLNEVVEEMEASVYETEELREIEELWDDYLNEVADYNQPDEPSYLPSLLSPLQNENQSPRYQQNNSRQSTLSNNSIRQVHMTSSPAGRMRVLENMNQASQIGEISGFPSARARLLWRDEPPNPADNPPRLLAVVEPRREESASEAQQSNPSSDVTETNPLTDNQEPNNDELNTSTQPGNQEQAQSVLDMSFHSYVSWESTASSDDIDSLGGILYAAERLGPMDQTIHMDVEMGDFGIGHILFDRASGTWATSHCEFHRID